MTVARTLDAPALEKYFSTVLPSIGTVSNVRQFDGGQSNPTYLITASSGQYVLRRKPPGVLLPSAHAVDREFRVIRALRNTDVPVPNALCFCDDPSIIGTVFYVMDYVPGEIYIDPDLPQLTAPERTQVYDELNRVIAALHSIDPQAIGLGDFGKSGNYAERQIARWTQQYRASETEKIDAMEHLIDWLPAHIPADEAEQTRIIHGDYRIGNVIFNPDTLTISAVLDWELATLGHPLADLAYNAMPYHLRPDILGGVLGEDLKTLGIPTEEDYLAAYCRRTGRAGIPDWRFCVAFSMFRLAAIAQGIMGRVIAGTANDAGARSRGERARPMAEAGWALVESRR